MAQFRGGRGPTQRQLRVGEELRHALADVLRRGDFRDPELLKLNVTVTEVRISPDLRNATAFITPLGGGDMQETVTILRRAAPFFRSQLARGLKLRFVPNLFFEPDTSFDYAKHINNILHRPDVARDLSGHVAGQEDEDDDDDDWDDAEDLDGEEDDEDDDEDDEDDDDEDDDDVEYEEDDDLDDDDDEAVEDIEYEDEDLDDSDGDADDETDGGDRRSTSGGFNGGKRRRGA